MNHLLSLCDITQDELDDILTLSVRFKKEREEASSDRQLNGKTVALIFSKASTRTRVSFQVAISELGGHSLFLDHNSLQLGRGESMSDTAKVLSRYIHAVVIRSHEHDSLVEYAGHSTIPVINALTDRFHPCQLLADLLTILEVRGELAGAKVAYLGDGAGNMAHSWAIAAKLAGVQLRIGAPRDFQLSAESWESVSGEGTVYLTENPTEAVEGADFVYTDVWVSMGFEEEAENRSRLLSPYQVNEKVLRHASQDVKIMHCLPAKRGKEITADVLDGPASIVWQQAENRLHAQKAILALLC